MADSSHVHRFIDSPNHGPRLNGHKPTMLLLHYTGMEDEDAAVQRLCEPSAEVSAHYLIFENGHIAQLVPEERRAWHAGISKWQGIEDINSCSIGIEIAHPGHDGSPKGHLLPYSELQIASLILLAKDIVARWNIMPELVLAHSDVAPTRKQDPGETFPWERLHHAGIGHYVRPAPIRGGRFLSPGDQGQPVEALQAMLAMYGYGLPVTGHYDALTQAVVTAFQRHFRPERVDGIADASSITTLRDLIASRPSVTAVA